MTAPLWNGVCPHCKETFPLEQSDEHRAACEARGRELIKTQVERPRTWSFDVAVVRELVSDTPNGKVRKYFAGTTDQLITRAQLIAFRDLITLALAESPEPVPVVPAPGPVVRVAPPESA